MHCFTGTLAVSANTDQASTLGNTTTQVEEPDKTKVPDQSTDSSSTTESTAGNETGKEVTNETNTTGDSVTIEEESVLQGAGTEITENILTNANLTFENKSGQEVENVDRESII
ncbi:hypothetical protein AM501_13140 [Aneurinibacillus migulanus]|nr:hypothetical protein AM501_13140 [Aneurinibacillus migulanus]